jgi:uncharacterized protein with beta-barrel porin domain
MPARAAWRRALLTTTSIVSIAGGALIGEAPSPALAACATNITGNVAGCTNSTTITGINIHNANVSSSINNTGTISPNGITVQTNSTISGINETGTLTGGISIDNTSAIEAATAIAIQGPTFGGGISNSGTLAAHIDISVEDVSAFSGGIVNRGTMSATLGTGIILLDVSTFTGGISNSGTISAGSGILVDFTNTFTGGITNSGIVAGLGGINILNVTTFQGNIVNVAGTGQITGGVGVSDVATFNGSIINNNSISGQTGILVSGVTTFTGNIGNAGTISAARDGIVIQGSTINGSITDNGNILAGLVGIAIEGGTINSSHTAVHVQTVATFTGGISNAGTINAVDDGIGIGGVGTFLGGITNSGTISSSVHVGIGVGSVTTFTGGISNSGTITVAGSGIVAAGVSTFAGGILNSGTLSAGAQGINVNSSAFSGGISNGGIISAGSNGIAVAGVTTFGGNISNSGTISAAIGIKIASGVTFAAGGVIANSGNITGTTTAIDASAATAPVTIDQSGGTITGAIKLSANADVLNITGGTINGNIVGQGASDTINFAPSGFLGTFTYATPYGFTGINQVNINSGFVVLDGNDNATNIDVNGGVLFGTGTLDPLAVTIHSGGTLAPGGVGTPGTMTINGNLVFLSGATYLVQIGAGGASLVNVSGTATLAGTVSAVLLPGATIAHQYTILHSAGLGGTTFSSLDVFGGITANLVYLPNPSATDVDLDITANLGMAAPAGGFNINQQNVSTSLTNYFNSGGTLTPGISTVFGLSGPALANALTQLSGEAATGTQQVSTQMMNEFLDMMLDPFVAGRDTGGGGGAGTSNGFAPERQAGLPPDIALAYDSVMPAPRPADFDRRWSVWGSGFGGSSTTSGDAVVGSHDVTATTYGAAAGMDYHFSPDSVLGFALAGAGSNWSLTQSLGGGRDTAFQAGVYGKTNFGPAYLAAAFAFANHWFGTNRTAFAGDQLGASFQGQSYGGRFEAGYRFAVAAASGITPYAAVQAQAFHTPGYSETDLSGGGFALSYGAMNATDTRSELGARFDSLQILDNMPIVWHGRVAWAHDWVSNPALGATFESLPGASFTVNGAAPPPNSALASAGAKFYITPSWSFDTKFDGEFASGSQTYAGTGTLRYSW